MEEQLVALCDNCNCCLPKRGHCWICHTTMSIEETCGDDMCEAKMRDYIAREEIRKSRRLVNFV